MPDFPSTRKPDYPIEEAPAAPEVLISVHKDGTEQRRLKGGGVRRTFRLTFGGSMPLTNAERVEIVNHFAAQNGTAIAFNWQHPERTDETYLVRYLETPKFSLVGYNCYQGEVALQEVWA
jgi:phage-related protein